MGPNQTPHLEAGPHGLSQTGCRRAATTTSRPVSPVQAQILESLSPQQGSLGTVLGSTTQETAVGAAEGEGHEHFLNLEKRRLDSLNM